MLYQRVSICVKITATVASSTSYKFREILLPACINVLANCFGCIKASGDDDIIIKLNTACITET